MEQQINILIMNCCLLILNLIGAFWISKKFNNLNKVSVKTKSNQYPEELLEVYTAINHGLKSGQQTIEIPVDDVPINWFVPLYQGLTKFYGFKLDLKVRYFSKVNYSEYLVVDLTSYKGSLHKPLEPKLIWDKEPLYWDEDPIVVVPQQASGMESVPLPFYNKHKNKPNLQLVSNKTSDNVIDFNAYKNKRIR